MYVSRTAFDSRCMINEARKYCDLDLEVVSMEGAVIQTSKLLFVLASHSPWLQDLLTSDTPSRILLPDIPTQSIYHLLNVLTQGYTTGLGSGDAVVKGMKEAAKVLGLPKFPVIAFEVEGNRSVWPSDEDVIQWFTERIEVHKKNDIVEVVEIDTENNDDDGVESTDPEIKEQSNTWKVLSVGDINKKHLNNCVGDVNRKHPIDNANQLQGKRCHILVDPKTVQMIGKVQHSSVYLDPVPHKETNLPLPTKNLIHAIPRVSKGKLGDKVNVPTLTDEILSNMDKIRRSFEPDQVNCKNRNLSQPESRVFLKPMSKKNRPILSGRQQSQGNFPPKTIPLENLTKQKSDDSIRKSGNHVAITSYSSEVLSTVSSSTQLSPTHSCDATAHVESASAPKCKHLGKLKDLRKPKDQSTSKDISKYKDTSKFQDSSKLKEASKPKGPSKFNDPSKVSKMDCEVELVEHTKRHNQEVIEAVSKVLKAELEGGIDDKN